ncbi:outer membrane beta-barrel protein [Niastella yeongjuensis]|nr:outer membrane beta-barrel protein [Niastella yeongjuensis]SEN65944.1 Outer membrane protein beta-barrel domain-containing protein [Niastella yeongjuensis]
MKQKLLLSLVFVCAFMVTTRAQISKGAVWVGGSIGYSKGKSGVDSPIFKSNNFNINPAIGMVVKDNLVVGISLLYNHGKSEYNGQTTSEKTNTYGGGFFVRQYIPVVTRLYIFGEADAYFNSLKRNSIYGSVTNGVSKLTNKIWTAGLSVTPGVSFAVTKKFHLETSFNNLLGIAYNKSESKTELPAGSTSEPTINKSNEFTAGVSTGGRVEFNVGCRFIL